METEIPGFDHRIAARLGPGIEDLHQPAFDFSGIDADVAGAVVACLNVSGPPPRAIAKGE